MLKLLHSSLSVMILLTLLTSCNPFCPDGAIEWVDLLMVNDVTYQHFPLDGQIIANVEKGDSIGEVDYTMADNACGSHRIKNGDAAYLSEGTIIYEIKGYPDSLLVLAGNKIYKAEENNDADVVGELYPIDGLVKHIHIKSIVNDNRIHTFSAASKRDFLNEWLLLKLVDPEGLQEKGFFKGERIKLEIELENGVTFFETYWVDSNTFKTGSAGTERIEKIMEKEIALLN